jgi:WD repeat-containing protein 19
MEALRLYEKSVLKDDNGLDYDKKAIEQHNLLCFSGIARTSIKNGDVSRGFNIAMEINDPQVYDLVLKFYKS